MTSVGNWIWVEAQTGLASELWKQVSGPWWQPGAPYTHGAQRKREKAYDRALREVQREAGASRRNPARTQERLISTFARFAAHALDLDGAAIALLTDGFLPVGARFARCARRFDASLPTADTIQACRNAWTACGLQPLLGAPMGLTSSILGYSLLYPYTDNYLDQRLVSREEKICFGERFAARLAGEVICPVDAREQSIWELVRMIEEEYPRQRFPLVFASLLAIHRAQQESISQLDSRECLDDSEILRISCAKGGTSVLADAFLVRGDLNPQEIRFAFNWGVLLQLGDDLQDVHEDLARGSDTLFTRAVLGGRPLDSLVSQLLNFSDLVSAELDRMPHGGFALKALLRMSWRSLVLMAVAYAHEYFSPAFLATLENQSPFRFTFLRARRDKLNGDSGLVERMVQILVEGGEEDGEPLRMPPARQGVSLNPATSLAAGLIP